MPGRQLQDLGEIHQRDGAPVQRQCSSALYRLHILRLETSDALHVRRRYDE